MIRRKTAKGKHARAKRSKLPSIPSLIKKLDRIFSVWVRLRDADEGGSVSCVTCGKLEHWQNVHCGHFIKRQHQSVRFDPRNCHAQCVRCNLHMGGQQDEYALFIARTYGQEALEELMTLKRQSKKWTREELQTLIAFYESAAREQKSVKLRYEG